VGALSGGALHLYGYGALDLVVFVVGIAGLALLALCALAAAGAALALRRRLRRREAGAAGLARLDAGAWARTGFALPDWPWLPLVQVRWEWLEPRGVECRAHALAGRLAEEIRPTRRALASRLRRRVISADAFGLARVAFQHEVPAALTVLPDRGHLRQAPVLAALAGADGIPYPRGAPEGDRMEIRRYAPGDSVRDILWKAYARTRQLSVRRPERSVLRSRRLVAYLVAGEGDEPAAAAARVALESGALGEGWVFGADGSPGCATELAPALEAVARSGGASGPTRLCDFLDSAEVDSAAHCVVFAPALAGEWVAEVARLARREPGRLSCVLGADGVARPGRARPAWRRLLLEEPPSPGAPAAELDEVVAELSRSGAPILVVDRSSGRVSGRAAQGAGL
jgi:uncharacterized protein (DUF58 family)